jgi:hypothetical protein
VKFVSNLPLILKIGQIESTSIFMAAPRSGKANPVESGVFEARVRIAKIQDVVGGLALIEPNPANFHSCLEGMATASPGKVIDDPVGRAHLVVRVDVVDRGPIGGLNGVVQGASLRIDKWGPVHEDLGLIQNSGRKLCCTAIK